MGALGTKLRSIEGGLVAFWCPACDQAHQLRIDPAFGSAWGYNGDPDAPTFTPSILVRSGHYFHDDGTGQCWCTYEKRFGRPAPFACIQCHSFVTDGLIQFLGDCSHKLAGQTLALPDWPSVH